MTHTSDTYTKKLLGLVLLLATLVSFCSCGDKGGKKRSTGSTVGSAPYELLLVANKEWLKTSEAQPLLDAVNSFVPGIPQAEQNFRVTTINPVGFNNTFKVYANIIFAETDAKYTKPEIKIARDVYVHPQTIMYIHASSGAELAQLVAARHDFIVETFVNAELARERKLLQKSYSGKVMKQAETQFGCKLKAPKDIDAVKTGKDFFWASSQGRDNILNICMYAYPLTDADSLTLDNFYTHREAFMKPNIQGETEDEWMSVDKRFVESRTIQHNGHTVFEVRGLWQMENAPLGGPFISYSQIDSARNRVIVTEGFVMAPEMRKREFIRELEAALQTLDY